MRILPGVISVEVSWHGVQEVGYLHSEIALPDRDDHIGWMAFSRKHGMTNRCREILKMSGFRTVQDMDIDVLLAQKNCGVTSANQLMRVKHQILGISENDDSHHKGSGE